MTNDLTKGSPIKQIILFSLPLLLGNIFQQLYNMADTVIVGRTIGVNALAAVGATGSLMFMILGFVQYLTTGFAVVTAQRFGAGDNIGVRQSAAVSMALGAVSSVLLTVIAVLMVRPLLSLMDTPPELFEDAASYITVIFSGIAATVLFNLLSNIIRALGDSKTPLLFLAIACAINIALDFLFICTFGMGVAGAGWATIVAQIVSGVLCLFYIKRKFPILHLQKSDWKVAPSFVGAHLRIGLPMGFQSSIIAIGALVLQTTLNGLGSVAVAAWTAAAKIEQMATQPMMSFGVTMTTYVAQNYGANQIARIKKGILQCSAMSLVFSIVIGCSIILAGNWLVGLIVGANETEVIATAKIFLLCNGSLYFILSMLFVFRYTLQGLGSSLIPTLAGVMELLMRSIAAPILGGWIGFAGVCIANPLAWFGALVPVTIALIYTMRRLSIQAGQEPETKKGEEAEKGAVIEEGAETETGAEL